VGRTLTCMNIPARLLRGIPEPSVRLFLGLCFLSAFMMLGFLLIRSSYDEAAVQHRLNIAPSRSKAEPLVLGEATFPIPCDADVQRQVAVKQIAA
jgi:hypothetical protein